MRRVLGRALVGVLTALLVAAPAAPGLAAPPVSASTDKPDRARDDGIPKPSKLRVKTDVEPVDPFTILFHPVATPNPAVYGQDIVVTIDYTGPWEEGLAVKPTCAIAPEVVANGLQVGDYPNGLVCTVAEPNPTFTIGVPQPVTGPLSITPAPLTVTASSAEVQYGTLATITPSFSGFVYGQGPEVVTTNPTCSTTATTTSGVGPYPSTCTGGSAANYTMATFVPGTVTVVPAALLITPSSPTGTYGTIPTVTPNFTGLVNGAASLGTQPKCVTSVTVATGAGSFTDTTSCSGAVSSNYTISYGPPGTTTITPAPLTVTAVGQSRLVGQPNGPFTATFSGFVAGQNQSVLAGTLVFTTDATQASGPGSYPLLPSGLSSPNYSISFVPGTIRVTATPPTPTPTPSPTVTPTKSPTPTPSPTRTNTGSPTPPPGPPDGGWPLWLTILLIALGVLVIALLVIGGVQLARRGHGEHTASE